MEREKTMMKRLIAALAALALTLALCGYGAAAEDGHIALPEGYTVRQAAALDGTLYLGASGGQTGDGYTVNAICAAPAAGGTAEALYTGGDIGCFAPALDGSVWLAESGYDGAGGRSAAIVHAVDGDAAVTVPLTDLGQVTDENYVNSMFPGPDGGVLVYIGGTAGLLASLDGEGRVLSAAPVNGGWFESLERLETGELAGVFTPWDGLAAGTPYLALLEPATGAVTALPVSGDAAVDGYTVVLAGDGDTVWLQLGGAVRPYDRASGIVGDGDSWINLDVNVYDMVDAFLLDGALWTAVRDGDRLLTAPVRAGDDGRQVLTVAAMGADWILTPAVAAFNQTHPDCRIEIHDYLAENTYIDQALERFNYDVISGDIPDLYYLNDMPYDTLVRQGLLADLSSYVNSLDLSLYLENVLCAARQADGALYSVIPTFTVSALAAPADAGLTAADMTVPALMGWQAQHPDTAVIRAYAGGETETLTSLIGTDIERYVNFNDSTCSFDSPEFTDLLTMVRDMPKTVADSQMGGVVSGSSSLLRRASLENYGALDGVRQQEGFDPVLLGWPGETGGVTEVRPGVELAMSARTSDPEVCWAFISSFLAEGFQSTTTDLESGGFEAFPVMRATLDAGAQIFTQYGGVSQEDIDYVNSILAGTDLAVSRRFSLAGEVLSIVREEAEPFFQGQATAGAAAAAIQSRVGIYLAEHS